MLIPLPPGLLRGLRLEPKLDPVDGGGEEGPLLPTLGALQHAAHVVEEPENLVSRLLDLGLLAGPLPRNRQLLPDLADALVPALDLRRDLLSDGGLIDVTKALDSVVDLPLQTPLLPRQAPHVEAGIARGEPGPQHFHDALSKFPSGDR